MNHTDIQLGENHCRLPAITLGTTRYGMSIDKKTAFALLDTYLAGGGSWIDTARAYSVAGVPLQERHADYQDSEEVIGEWLRSRQPEGVTIVTKGAHWSYETGAKRVNADAIRHDFERSQEALGVEQIGIYLLHNDDESQPVESIMPVLHELIRMRKVLAIGASNWRVERIEEANHYARKHHLTPFHVAQVRWSYAAAGDELRAINPLDLSSDREQADGYMKLGLPLMAYSSQAKGFFVKAIQGMRGQELGRAQCYESEDNLRKAARLEWISQKYGISAATAALAYLWSRAVPVTALVGCRTPEQLEATMAGCDCRIAAELFEE